MSIKATFPAGAKTVSVSGLYQWDYGQILEIESADMGTEIVEVHFACPSMSEAVVRSCSFTNGVGTVTIPDTCLEQTNTITAWVYRISGTQGHTLKTITMPITARTRPAGSRDIPQEISNKYTELLTELNEVIDSLEKGDVPVTRALNADSATTAGNAQSAAYAVAAGSADSASHATTADSATIADKIYYSYLRQSTVSTDGIEDDFFIKKSTYIVTACFPNQGMNVRETMIFSIPQDGGSSIHSTPSVNGYHCFCVNDHLYFYDSGGNRTTAEYVEIRKI